MTSTEHKQPDSDWQECPTGEVGQLVSRLRTRRRRQTLTQAAVGVTGLCLLVVAGFFAIPSATVTEGEPSYGGITCSEVRRQAVAYVSGTLDQLIAEKIKSHLDECGSCRRRIEQMPATAFLPDRSPQMIAERNQPPVDSHLGELVAFSTRQ